MTTGAEAFPYPDDEPSDVRNLATRLHDAAEAAAGAVQKVRGGKGAIADRWDSDAGRRAATEIDAVAELGSEAAVSINRGTLPLDRYATALDSARGAIDTLRAQYDQAEADFADTIGAAAAGGAGRGALHDDALQARSRRRAALQARYDDVIVTIRKAATNAGQALGDIARRISPAPHARNPALVRANVLDRLPFMASHRGVRVLRTGGLVLVDTGDADDDVRITHDPRTGQVTITVNGAPHRFSAAEAGNIVVRTQGGSDVIEVAPEVRLGFTVLGGDDRDLIAGGAGGDVLLGGHSADRVVGGGANDAMAGGSNADLLTDDLGFLDAAALPSVFAGRTVRSRAGSGNDIIAGDGPGVTSDAISDIDIIDGGDGDDIIEGGASDDAIHAGDGDDVIDAGPRDDIVHAGGGDDMVAGGDGRDYIDGHRGDDRIDGGDDDDIVHAGEGDDIVAGGEGRDYIDGYRGNDRIDGGDGSDVASGGAGDDTLTGGRGNDVVYAGAGRDSVTDRAGTNRIYREDHDTVAVSRDSVAVTVEIAKVPSNIRIEGSPEFQDRARADLETLASSPVGQKLLGRISEQGDGFLWTDGDQLTIREQTDPGRTPGEASSDGDRHTVTYKPDLNYEAVKASPSTPLLQHEMVHVYNDMSGTFVGYDDDHSNWYLGPDARQVPPGVDADRDGRVTFDEVDRDDDGDIDHRDLDLDGDGKVDGAQDGWIRNLERQAVGLPIDHDGNPATPDVPASDVTDHPDELTENALRDEMGLPRRDRY